MEPTSIGEVTLREVLGWAQDQAEYLTPTQHHVLLYLTMNAFITSSNPEGALPGQVYSARSSTASISIGTGLCEKTVRTALRDLQDPHGIILSELRRGIGKSRIIVFWSEEMDTIRKEVRAGARRLPKPFRRDKQEATVTGIETAKTNVVQFPFR